VLSAWIDTWLAPEFATWSLDDELPLVTCPLLAIHGDQDEFGSVRHPQRLGSLTSGPAIVEVLAGCGHVPHREKPEVVLALIKPFLAAPVGPPA
jgi:pimeloyl-ACP methyl ester carboxylesterase